MAKTNMSNIINILNTSKFNNISTKIAYIIILLLCSSIAQNLYNYNKR